MAAVPAIAASTCSQRLYFLQIAPMAGSGSMARVEVVPTVAQTKNGVSPAALSPSIASSSSSERMAKFASTSMVSRNLRTIDVDANFAMRSELLEEAIEGDKAAGLTPFFVCATVGTTSTLAIDPLPAIGAICKKYNLWLHVDAAMAGTAAIVPEFRYIIKGLELAD